MHQKHTFYLRATELLSYVTSNDSLDDISSDIEDNEAEEKKPLDKLTVQELKYLAEKKNLKRYKSLTKPKLIELIEKAE